MKIVGKTVHLAQVTKDWVFFKFTDGSTLHFEPVTVVGNPKPEIAAVLIEPKDLVQQPTPREALLGKAKAKETGGRIGGNPGTEAGAKAPGPAG